MVKSYDMSKSGYFYVELIYNPFFFVYNKIGEFLDLGSHLKLQDGDIIIRGFPLHILRASRTLMGSRYDGCNVEEQMFAHLIGARFFLSMVRNEQNISPVPKSLDG